tara:strand:+ start:874 stop:1401 length:528 start_codon:yes stop_codon:yes gene_type:complete
MDIKGIISISGKPGLHKVISQTKNGLIAESLIDNKRFPVYSNQQISALEDISIYTYEDDILLSEVFGKLYEIEGGKESINHKSSAAELSAKVEEALPNYDKERVYASDVKKIVQWYNLLIKNNLLKPEVKEEEKKEKKAPKAKTEDTPKKKPATKKPAAKKAEPKKKTSKKDDKK